jgi:two-component system, OmpR family, sensor histidine kinase KdpD
MDEQRRRGRLRLYLGASPGVGKTYAMLGEAHRRSERGTDVMVAAADGHGRPRVEASLHGLGAVPQTAGSVDVEAVLARAPDVVVVDDLATPNPPGARNAHRWQDVEELLDAGLDVISCLDIEHLESLADVVEQITGVPQEQSVPDHVVRSADQIELVDMTPEALRRRMAHGNIYPADQVDAALSHHFRAGNLAALRELALIWLADRVDERLEAYRRDHGIARPWPARERVVVALTGGPEGELLLRRGARIAARGTGGELHVVHVQSPRGPRAAPGQLERLRRLTEELGGTHHTVVADNAGEAVLELARSLNASQVVVGASRRPRWRRLLLEGVGDAVVADADDLDVLVVTHPLAIRGRSAPVTTALGRRRVLLGWATALAGPALVTAVLVPLRDDPTAALAAMAYLALTVFCALVGGLRPAVTAALIGSVTLNWFFTPPEHTLTIADPVNAAALVLFLLVGVAVASVVDKAARRGLEADQARREASTLTELHRTLLQADHDVAAVLELIRDSFAVDSVSLLRCADEARDWSVVRASGEDPPRTRDEAEVSADVSPSLVLALRGADLAPHERRVLASFATHLAVVLERDELAERAASATALEQGNRVRNALLAAVSHDLRTPLAGIKAAVSSLRSPDVVWSEDDRSELLATIDSSTDRLHDIVSNLLDLSRLQSDAVRPILDEIGLDDVVARTVAALPGSERVELSFAPDLPPVLADAGLLDRVVANLVDNAVRHTPPGVRVRVATSQVGDRVQLHVVDRGPGVPDLQKEQMFAAFQRLGDDPGREGLGLGLAVARGLTEALEGQLVAEDTPGGGLTMVVDLPAVRTRPRPGERELHPVGPT